MLGPRFFANPLPNAAPMCILDAQTKRERLMHMAKQNTGSGCGTWLIIFGVAAVIGVVAKIFNVSYGAAVVIILAAIALGFAVRAIIKKRKKVAADAAAAEAAAKAEAERAQQYQAAQEAAAQKQAAIADAAAAAAEARAQRYQAAREAEEQRKARAKQIFQDLLDKLEIAPVTVDAAASLQPLALADMPDIHYTSVSASFNRDTMPAFVVIDTETTGLSARSDGIVELSAIRFEEFHPVAGWTTLVNPGRRIPPEASAVNNITDAMVSGAPTIDQVAQSFLDFCGSAPIVGYNLPFDFKMLYASGIDLAAKRRKYYDVYAIAKKYFKGDMALSSYKLGYVASQCGLVPVDSHRSLSDCLTTGLLFDRLIDNM